MQVGRSIVGTIALFLVVLMASPVYDMYTLHQQKHKSAEGLLSQERRCAQKCSLTMQAGHALVRIESKGVQVSPQFWEARRRLYKSRGIWCSCQQCA